MKSILMLGGSQQQVVAIETAKRLGFRTVLCDYLPDNPGQFIADIFYQVSTTDRNKVLEIAVSEDVSGVLAYASDPAAPTAAYVAEKMHLPTNSLSSVETLSTKYKFRAALETCGAPFPNNIVITKNTPMEVILSNISKIKFPIVIKPTDSSGSKGVTFVSSKDDLVLAVNKAFDFSRNGVIIAEEYITYGWPYVIGGDIFVNDGVVCFWGCMSCLRSNEHPLVPQGKFYPSGLNERQLNSIKVATQKIIDELNIKFGEFNIEVIVDDEGNANYLELGARAGGNMIPIQLSDISGIDLVEANVLAAMGEPVHDIELDGMKTPNGCFATYVIHAENSGIFERLIIDSILDSFLYRLVMYKEPGDKIEKFVNASHALGIAFLRFDNEKQMHYVISNIQSYFQVLVDPTR